MKGPGKREIQRKPTYQWHRPAIFPREKIRKRPRWQSNPGRDSLKYVVHTGRSRRSRADRKIVEAERCYTARQDQRDDRMIICGHMVGGTGDDRVFLNRIITGSETKCFLYDPQPKKQPLEIAIISHAVQSERALYCQWRNDVGTRIYSSVNFSLMANNNANFACPYSLSIVHVEFTPRGATVNKTWCVESNWLLLHDNAAEHSSVLVQEGLVKQQVTVLPHLSYANIPQQCIQQLHQRWQTCVVTWSVACGELLQGKLAFALCCTLDRETSELATAMWPSAFHRPPATHAGRIASLASDMSVARGSQSGASHTPSPNDGHWHVEGTSTTCLCVPAYSVLTPSWCARWSSGELGIGKFREFNDLQARLHSPVYTRASEVSSLAAAPKNGQCYSTPVRMALAACFLASLLVVQSRPDAEQDASRRPGDSSGTGVNRRAARVGVEDPALAGHSSWTLQVLEWTRGSTQQPRCSSADSRRSFPRLATLVISLRLTPQTCRNV
ncbi:hypothetical protein PR048_017973 [Dryococelus australis]|uniref:Tc1-like transposase DDE domain-containing protein n=1 Tax=Dryococelus australis TaxID=614101 RepID=A0ABQ9HAY9_9NEOP|nr:hypothetical protein PR048_017973 [Dryococelus australis]